MGLTRVSTLSGDIIIEEDGKTFAILSSDTATKDKTVDDKTLKDALEKKVGDGTKLKVGVFYHKNLGGSVAIATGMAPAVWPEDE